MRMIPANATESGMNEKSPIILVEVERNTLNPAAGPNTAKGEEDKKPKKSAPKIALIIPASGAAPEATAIPAESGNETSKSDKDDRKSSLFKGVRFKDTPTSFKLLNKLTH